MGDGFSGEQGITSQNCWVWDDTISKVNVHPAVGICKWSSKKMKDSYTFKSNTTAEVPMLDDIS